MKIINFKKKKLKLLTKGQQESYENTKIGHICKRKIENKYLKGKKIVNLEIIGIIQENKEVLPITFNLKYVVLTRCLQFFIMNLVMIII